MECLRIGLLKFQFSLKPTFFGSLINVLYYDYEFCQHILSTIYNPQQLDSIKLDSLSVYHTVVTIDVKINSTHMFIYSVRTHT